MNYQKPPIELFFKRNFPKTYKEFEAFLKRHERNITLSPNVLFNTERHFFKLDFEHQFAIYVKFLNSKGVPIVIDLTEKLYDGTVSTKIYDGDEYRNTLETYINDGFLKLEYPQPATVVKLKTK